MKLIAIILLTGVASCQENDPIVTFPLGQVVGKVLKSRQGINFYGFRGLPYAEPPVGHLRFKVSCSTLIFYFIFSKKK